MNEYVPTDKGVFVLFLLTFWFCFGFVVFVWDGVFLHFVAVIACVLSVSLYVAGLFLDLPTSASLVSDNRPVPGPSLESLF